MNIKYLYIIACIGLFNSITAAAAAGQPEINYADPATTEAGNQFIRTLQQDVENLQNGLTTEEINNRIVHTQAILENIALLINSEVERREHTSEYHTVAPLIKKILQQLHTDLETMRNSLEAITQSAPTKSQLATSICALERLFAIINKQPEAFQPEAHCSFVDCLRQAPLAQQLTFCTIVKKSYSKIMRQNSPENINKCLMDLYMQLLMSFDNMDLLLDNLACYLAPNNISVQQLSPLDQCRRTAAQYAATAQQQLQRGQQFIQIFANEQLPNLQAEAINKLANIASTGTQLDTTMQKLNEALTRLDEQLRQAGTSINQIAEFLNDNNISWITDKTRYVRHPIKASANNIFSFFSRGTNLLAESDEDDEIAEITGLPDGATTDAFEKKELQPQPTSHGSILCESNLKRKLQQTRAALNSINQHLNAGHLGQIQQLLGSIQQSVIQDKMIALSTAAQQQIPAYLGQDHFNITERLQGIVGLLTTFGNYAQQSNNLLLRNHTREERLGSPAFRTWLETMARTWDPAAAEADAPR